MRQGARRKACAGCRVRDTPTARFGTIIMYTMVMPWPQIPLAARMAGLCWVGNTDLQGVFLTMDNVHAGSIAPDFSLVRSIGSDPTTLSQFRGQPVVLLFVPLAFSHTCTEELCHVAENWALWKRLGPQVLAISIDSPFVNERWGNEMGLEFPILSDFNKEASTAYGVLQDDFFGLRGVAKRSAFVVDGGGLVRYRWVSDDPSVLPPFSEITDLVEALQGDTTETAG